MLRSARKLDALSAVLAVEAAFSSRGVKPSKRDDAPLALLASWFLRLLLEAMLLNQNLVTLEPTKRLSQHRLRVKAMGTR